MIERQHSYSITAKDRQKAATIIALQRTFSSRIIELGLTIFAIVLLADVMTNFWWIIHDFKGYIHARFLWVMVFALIILALERGAFFHNFKTKLKKYFKSNPPYDTVSFAWDDTAFWVPDSPEKTTAFRNVEAQHITTGYQFLRFSNGSLAWMPTRSFDVDTLQDITAIVRDNIPKSNFWQPL